MGGFFTLGRWYADPCPPEAAHRALAAAQVREQQRLRRGRSALASRLAALLARASLGEDVQADYQRLAAQAALRGTRARALVELIYGQILMTRRQPGATAHLDNSFALARHLFAPGDYFAVLKRHALLAQLPPAELPPEPLQDLLTAARVMARLGVKRDLVFHDRGNTC